MITQEALKIDLENLIDRFNEGWHEGIEIDASDIMLLSNLRECLEQPAQKSLAKIKVDFIKRQLNNLSKNIKLVEVLEDGTLNPL